MRRYFNFLLLFFVVLMPNRLYSQSAELYFNHLKKNDGLASNRVNCILEDKEGFIWFATEDGLCRYDGYDYKTFRNVINDSTSISNNDITVIKEDEQNGNLWVGTASGLDYFDKSSFKFKKIELNIPNQIKQQTNAIPVNTLCFDKNKLWIGSDFGLICLDTTLLKTKWYNSNGSGSISSDIVQSIFYSTNNQLWIGTSKGIDQFDYNNNTFTHCFSDSIVSQVYCFMQDSEGDIWVGTDTQGIFLVDIKKTPIILKHYSSHNNYFTNNRIHGIIEDLPHSFFIIERDGGLYYLNKKTETIKPYNIDSYNENSLNSKALISIYKDSAGSVWLGTFNSGVNYIDKFRKPFKHYKINFKETGLFNHKIRSFFEDADGTIWIGTKEEGGLSKFDKEKGTFTHYKKDKTKPSSLSDEYIFAINEIDDNRLILGTYNSGIDIFDKKTGKVSNYQPNANILNNTNLKRINAFAKDAQGAIWIGLENGLEKFEPNTNTPHLYTQFGRVRTIFADKNILWLGTFKNGLFLFDTKNAAYQNYKADSKDSLSLSNNHITCIAKDNENMLWIGTYSGGVNKFNPDKGTFEKYTVANGLSSNLICGMQIDQFNNCWVSTGGGISAIDIKSGTIRNFDVRDGLQGNEFEKYVSLKTRDGEVLFGGINGFNIFRPEAILINQKKPKIVITSFKIFNHEVPIATKESPLKKNINLTKKLELQYWQSSFSFDFVALSFTSAQKNKYKYILENFNKNWIDAGTKRSAVYTNIQPGKYTFKVMGANNDGVWCEQAAAITIIVRPPFWRTAWAYIFYFIFIGLSLLFVRKIIISKVKQNDLLEYERIDKARIIEMNQMKLQFFTNISHEFRTPLTLISGPLQKLSNMQTDSEQQYLFQLMQKNVKRMLRLVKQLMDFRKVENMQMKLNVRKGNLHHFVNETIKGFEEQARQQKINLDIKLSPIQESEHWFDYDIVDDITFNLLSNALKFTPENKSIRIELKEENGTAYILVSDTGVGIPEDKIPHIFKRFYSTTSLMQPSVSSTGIGLSFSKNLAIIHKGDILVDSIEGEGSTFTFYFPYTRDKFDDNEMANINLPHTFDIIQEGLHETVLPKKNTYQNTQTKYKLLIVEDNVELRSFIVTHFDNTYNVMEAENGIKALAIIKDQAPDIIVSDVMMPEMDGLELCKKIKTNVASSHIPVILLTALSAEEQKIDGMETGADAYLTKPFNITLLELQMTNLLQLQKSMSERFNRNTILKPSEITVNSVDEIFLKKAMKYVEEHIADTDLTVENFSQEMGMSRSNLHAKLKALTTQTPSGFIRSIRLNHAAQLLQKSGHTIVEIAWKSGFSNASHFTKSFKEKFKESPSAYCDRIKGVMGGDFKSPRD